MPDVPARHPLGRQCLLTLPLVAVWLILAALIPALRRGER